MTKDAPSPLFDLPCPRVFSIDAGRPFLVDLGEELTAALGGDIAKAEIFLPNRRAVRAASDAFLEASAKRGRAAALLPRFRAIGDIDEDDPDLFAGDAADEFDIRPAINATERLIVLARLVAARDRQFAGQENWAAAINAARELGKLLDSFHAEEIDPATLANLDLDEFAEHWRRSLDFLEIIFKAWPHYLESCGRSDPALRRAKLIDAKARRIAEAPPRHPIIIAGTTASAPAVARFVRAVAHAPHGLVVLPGLDRTLDAHGWRSIDDAHPQAGLKKLLDGLQLKQSSVRAWPKSGGEAPRSDLLALALRPAEATDEWLSLIGEMTNADAGLDKSTADLSLIESETEEAEATSIAALFRQTLEDPDATAMLVTPDRNLSRRVALKMRRWGVTVDDSAGVPFMHSRCGVFLRLVAQLLETPGDAVSILALLRHPLTTLGMDASDFQQAADKLDLALRGVRPPNGLQGLRQRILNIGKEPPPHALAAIDILENAAAEFAATYGAAFPERLGAHIKAAERFAGDALWKGADGAKGASLLADFREADFSAFEDGSFTEIFDALVAGANIRQQAGAHPRLAILGPLEARLQSASHIILGGLNEGVWPQGAADDPFLSRRLRQKLGLPSPEHRIGLSAHDFAQLAAAPRVTLTRSKRKDGKPSKPSRWIVRLKNILTGAGAIDAVDRSKEFKTLAETIDRAERVEAVSPPQPKAGPGRTPDNLYVTAIERWIRDPYGVYARYLLRLGKLEEPGAPFGMREMGLVFHATFADAALADPAPSRAALQAIFDSKAEENGMTADDRLFWSATVSEALDWFAEFDAERREEGTAAIIEGTGNLTLDEIDPPFTISARADRIDIMESGEAALFDFKTGKIPTKKEGAIFNPQLPLTGMIIERGGFEDIGAARVGRFEYLKVANRKDKDSENSAGETSAEASAAAIAEAQRRLLEWIKAFRDPNAVYLSQPRPQFVDEYGDYDQLARRREWSTAGENGEDAS